MNKIILLTVVLGSILWQTSFAQPKHRHHRVEPMENTLSADTIPDEAVAYSDTTFQNDEAGAEDTALSTNVDYDNDKENSVYNPGNYHDPFTWMVSMGENSAIGFIIVMAILGVILFFCIVPFIIIILILRYLIKRHNRRVDQMAEQARQTSYEQKHQSPQRERTSPTDIADQELWRKGVRNVTIGLGVMVVFMIAGSSFMIGVGAFVAIFGGGQIYTAKHQQPVQKSPNNTETQTPPQEAEDADNISKRSASEDSVDEHEVNH